MKRWLSQTRVMAASRSARRGAYCPCRSSSGKRMRLPGHGFRRAPETQVVAGVRPLARSALTGVEDDFHILPGIGGEIHHDRNPAPLRRVPDWVDRLSEQVFVRGTVGHPDEEDE